MASAGEDGTGAFLLLVMGRLSQLTAIATHTLAGIVEILIPASLAVREFLDKHCAVVVELLIDGYQPQLLPCHQCGVVVVGGALTK